MSVIEQCRRHLADIPDLYTLAGRYILPGTKPADPDARAGAGTKSRPPLNLDVTDIRDRRFKDYEPGDDPTDAVFRLGVIPYVQLWQMLVYGELIDIGKRPTNCCIDTDDHTLAGECQWLDRWLPETIDMHPDFPGAIRKVHRRLEVACCIPPTAPFVCPKCGWEMFGQGDYDPELKRHPWYKCSGCPHTLTTAAEVAKVQASAEDYVTLKYAAEQVDKPFSTLRRWKQAGWITPQGRDQRGEIFSLAAIRRVATSVENGRRFSA